MRREGVALLEVMVALALLTGAVVALAGLFSVAARSNGEARRATLMTIAAGQKMEQLRGLSWAVAEDGSDLADVSTDVSVWPETGGGTGLRPSPPDTLTTNTAGFVDYLDEHGSWVGTGPAPGPSAAYIRRWSIEPLADSPLDTLVLRVVVVPRSAASAAVPREARFDAIPLSSVRARRGR
jgi:hypothetical protein